MSNPHLDAFVRKWLVKELLQARRDIAAAHRADSVEPSAKVASRSTAQVALEARGPVWWDEEEGDQNQRLAENSPYVGSGRWRPSTSRDAGRNANRLEMFFVSAVSETEPPAHDAQYTQGDGSHGWYGR